MKSRRALQSPCEAPELHASYYAYAGYKKGFTKHDYCARTHVGVEIGALHLLIKCGCECHKGWMMDKQYLGDGVYIEWDGDRIKLTTEDGISATNTIYLEHEVIEEFLRWTKKKKRVG